MALDPFLADVITFNVILREAEASFLIIRDRAFLPEQPSIPPMWKSAKKFGRNSSSTPAQRPFLVRQARKDRSVYLVLAGQQSR